MISMYKKDADWTPVSIQVNSTTKEAVLLLVNKKDDRRISVKQKASGTVSFEKRDNGSISYELDTKINTYEVLNLAQMTFENFNL